MEDGSKLNEKRQSYEHLIEGVMEQILRNEEDFEAAGYQPDELVDRALRKLGRAVIELEGLGREPTPLCEVHKWPMELVRGRTAISGAATRRTKTVIGAPIGHQRLERARSWELN
jgi:hypothetical protein